jgi:hypothetical protein
MAIFKNTKKKLCFNDQGLLCVLCGFSVSSVFIFVSHPTKCLPFRPPQSLWLYLKQNLFHSVLLHRADKLLLPVLPEEFFGVVHDERLPDALVIAV